MVFHWSLNDSKFPEVSRTLLSILTDLNNAVVWMVSTRPLIFKSCSPCSNPLVIVPGAPITYYYYYLTFSQYRLQVVFLRSLSDCKSPPVSRPYLRNWADFNNAIWCMVSILAMISTAGTVEYSNCFSAEW